MKQQPVDSDANGLTDKQQVWLEHYLVCWNATEAARKAGYASPRQSGYSNMTKDYIQNEIKARLSEKKMSADEALARLSAYAKADLTDFLKVHTHSGTATLDMNSAQAAGKLFLIKKYKETRYGHELELHDPLRALELVARHHGLFDDDDDGLKLPAKALELMSELDISKSQLAEGVLRLLEKIAETQNEHVEALVDSQ